MSKIYEIDPDADTLIVVRPSTKPFAPWPQGDASANGSAFTPAPEVRIKASSKHLSLASPYFRDQFALKTQSGGGAATTAENGNSSLWYKAATNGLGTAATTATSEIQPDGRTHLVIDGVDGAATTAVLNIVHGRGGGDRVPKSVDLETLARIAIVVDRFKLQDAVEIYADRWIGGLQRRGLPTRAGRDLVLWVYVAYVFQRAELFREATKIAATQSPGPLPSLNGLPLRAKIVAAIDEQRQEVIGKSLDLLQTAVDQLIRGEASTSDQSDTDSFLLGNLIRTLHSNGLIWPRPDRPYAGVSVAAVSRAAHDVQTQVWKLVNRLKEQTGNGSTGSGKQLLLTPQLDSLRAGITGLDLQSDLGYLLY